MRRVVNRAGQRVASLHSFTRMIPKKLLPHVMRDGNRFSDQIMRNQTRINDYCRGT
jgi:hypothetical protein